MHLLYSLLILIFLGFLLLLLLKQIQTFDSLTLVASVWNLDQNETKTKSLLLLFSGCKKIFSAMLLLSKDIILFWSVSGEKKESFLSLIAL